MSQRRFANSGQAVDPTHIAHVLLLVFIGHPGYGVVQERFAGAIHTAEFPVIARFDTFKSSEQELLLYVKLLRTTYHQRIETLITYHSFWLGGESRRPLRGRNPQ